MGSHLNYLRAKLIGYGSIVGMLAGLGIASQGDEAGAMIFLISLIIGFLNKFVFGIRYGQLKIDTMENVRDK